MEQPPKTCRQRTLAGSVSFAVPGDLATPTGGYNYDRRVVEELRRLGWDVEVVDLGTSFPNPTAETRSDALRLLAEVPEKRPIVIDGLAFGALPEAGYLPRRAPLLALIHQPLALHTGLDDIQARAFFASERAALASATHVVVTSDTTAQILNVDYDVAAERLSVASPGNEPAPKAAGSQDGVVRLLAVGSLVLGKGYDLLIPALAAIADLPWHLTIAGDCTREPETAKQLFAAIIEFGLQDKITMLGAVPFDQIGQLYLASDLFVLPSRFESYGMALTEALTHGLPVVTTTAGAIPKTVPAGAGILVPPDEVAPLACALRRLLENPAERRQLALNAYAAARSFPTWVECAGRFADAINLAVQVQTQNSQLRNDVLAH